MENVSDNSSSMAGRTKRGPRRIEYIPEKFRNIPGIELLATARQLQNLEIWLNLPAEKRPAFQKLGCSVSHGEDRLKNPPSSTWVASTNGVPQVIHIVRDPRSAYKWMKCENRPWNIADRHEPKPESTRYWIAIMERVDAYALEPDGVMVFSATRRKLRRGPNEGKMEVLVEGVYGWWEQEKYANKIIRYRAAFGEVFSGEDGSFWATGTKLRPFPQLTYADWVMMENNREAVADVDKFLEDQAVERVWNKLSVVNVARPIPAGEETIIRSVLQKLKLDEISPQDLDEVVPHISDLLSALGG